MKIYYWILYILFFSIHSGMFAETPGEPSLAEIQFFNKIKSSVARDDVVWIKNNVLYPCEVSIDGKLKSVKNADEFERNYSKIINAYIKKSVGESTANELIINTTGKGLKHGCVWFESLSLDWKEGRGTFVLIITRINNFEVGRKPNKVDSPTVSGARG